MERKFSETLHKFNKTEESLITGKFYGICSITTSAQEENGDQYIGTQKINFIQLILDIADKELYKALDNHLFSGIEEFRTPNEFTTTAQQETWIDHIPPILMFQIQRVKYDTETNMPQKNHGEFKFPTQFYADRILEEKKELSTDLRKRVVTLRSHTSELEAQLESIQNFRGSGQSLESILE